MAYRQRNVRPEASFTAQTAKREEGGRHEMYSIPRVRPSPHQSAERGYSATARNGANTP